MLLRGHSARNVNKANGGRWDWNRRADVISFSYDVIGYNRRTTPAAPSSDLDQARRLLDALTDRTGKQHVRPLDTLSGVLTQLQSVTDGLAVRDDVVREVCNRVTTYGPTGVSIAAATLEHFLPSPPDPIEALVDEYWNSGADPTSIPTRREEIANMIRWLKEREA